MYIRRCLFLFLALIVLVAGCKKEDDADPDNPPEVPAKIKGTIYWVVLNSLYAFDLETGVTTTPVTGVKYYNSATPAYDSGIVYTASSYGISAIDINAGKILFQYPYSSANYGSQASDNSGVVVGDSLIYNVGRTGSAGVQCLYAIHKKTGAIKWQRNLSPEHNFVTHPTVVLNGDQLFVRSSVTNSFTCLNKKTGALIWEKSVCQCSISERPVVRNNTIYAKTVRPNGVLAIDASTGTQKWLQQIKTVNDYLDDKVFFAGNDVVLASRDDKYLHFMDPATGGLRSEAMSTGYTTSWQVDDEYYFLSTFKDITAYNKANHRQLWQWKTEYSRVYDSLPGTIPGVDKTIGYTDLVATDKYVFMPASVFAPFKGALINDLYILDKRTGKVAGRMRLGDHISLASSIPMHYLLISEGKAYYGHVSGNARTY